MLLNGITESLYVRNIHFLKVLFMTWFSLSMNNMFKHRKCDTLAWSSNKSIFWMLMYNNDGIIISWYLFWIIFCYGNKIIIYLPIYVLQFHNEFWIFYVLKIVCWNEIVVKNLQQLLMNNTIGEKLERIKDLIWFSNMSTFIRALNFYFHNILNRIT